MPAKPKIKNIKCHKIINSRAEWTIETQVTLSDGSIGVQAVPNGASKGQNEAMYIRHDKAVDIVNHPLNDLLHGHNPFDQKEIDDLMIEMDGTPNKSTLGGNSILSVSLAVAKAAAASKGLELYEYLHFMYTGTQIRRGRNKKLGLTYPTPVFNVVNGGKHARNDLSFQEFMVIPSPVMELEDALNAGITIYNNLAELLTALNLSTGVGDEGGFAPSGITVPQVMDLLRKAVDKSYVSGKDVFFGMDIAAESFYVHDGYNIKEENLNLDAEGLMGYYSGLLRKYPIIYMEDPFYEGDIEGWEMFYKKFASKLMVVADDLVVTNPKFLKIALEKKLANAVIIKPNQVGTLTETLDFIRMAKDSKMSLILSHRSGDTAEDTFIADLAVAVEAEFMKAGSPVRGERVAKYNRLLDIRDRMS